jgi:reactive intermediate/imine deaminase
MRQIIRTETAPPAIGPYSQAVRAGDFLFVSGALGIDPATRKIVDGGVTKQAERSLRNLAAIVEAAGGTLASIVKTTVFLQSMDDFPAFNEIYGTFFPENPPARSTVQVARLPLGALVEIEAIVWLGR